MQSLMVKLIYDVKKQAVKKDLRAIGFPGCY